MAGDGHIRLHNPSLLSVIMILLIACNARFSHAAFALKTLRANLPPELHERSAILEFTIQNDPTEAAYEILKKSPKIIGLSVYLWNILLNVLLCTF